MIPYTPQHVSTFPIFGCPALTRGDVETGDDVIWDLIQVLAEPPDRVAVRGDEDTLSRHDVRDNGLLPLHQESVLGQLGECIESRRAVDKGNKHQLTL